MDFFDFSGIVPALPGLWNGMLMTLKLMVLGVIGGIALGTVLALMRLSSSKWLANLAGAPVQWADLDDYRTETAGLVLGGLVGDNLGQYDGEVVWSIAPSTIQRGLLWAGTNDGKLWLTKDVNAEKPTWIDVTKNIPGLPPWSAFPHTSAA